jgi:hypothetical protein
MARKPKVKTTEIKRGRRIVGRIYHFANRDVFLANKKLDNLIRFGEKCGSDAVRKEVAAWALDEETLTELRLKGLKWVGVQVRNNGDIYVTHISNYLDYEKTRPPAVVNSSVQRRYLPLKYFTHLPGRMKVPRR